MLAKSSEKANARTLRRQGLSYREILQKVNVAKSSISLWCRDIQLTPRQRQLLEEKKRSGLEKGRETISKVKPERKSKFDVKVPEIRRLYWEEEYSAPQIAQILGVKEYLIYWLMRRHNIPRRNYTQSSYVVNKSKPQFKVKKKLSPEEENLRIAGIMLYWAEGTKTRSGIDFTNSDAQMIRLFLKFLRQICGVGESRLRIHLYAYSYQNIDELKEYWHRVTNVPLAQFGKPYVRKGNPNVSGRKLPYGLIHIRYNDKKLLNPDLHRRFNRQNKFLIPAANFFQPFLCLRERGNFAQGHPLVLASKARRCYQGEFGHHEPDLATHASP